MMPIRNSPPPEAPRVEPGLNPNQPNARMKVPRRAIGMLWPGIGFGFPSLLYLPIRGAIAPARPTMPPTMWTTPLPAKSAAPFPFFFNDPATTDIYTLSLHDALPNVANQPCPWRDNWHTRGSSVPVLSYWGQLLSSLLRARRIGTELSHDVLNPARVPL